MGRPTLVLTPFSIAGRNVVYPGKKLKLLQRYLLRLDSQLLIQLPLRGALDAHDCRIQIGAGLSWYTEWVGAASICPHIWECDLFGCSLLEKELVLGVEKENGKGTVKKTLVNVLHQMAYVRSVRGRCLRYCG